MQNEKLICKKCVYISIRVCTKIKNLTGIRIKMFWVCNRQKAPSLSSSVKLSLDHGEAAETAATSELETGEPQQKQIKVEGDAC
jgi:hypothetical protein